MLGLLITLFSSFSRYHLSAWSTCGHSSGMELFQLFRIVRRETHGYGEQYERNDKASQCSTLLSVVHVSVKRETHINPLM